MMSSSTVVVRSMGLLVLYPFVESLFITWRAYIRMILDVLIIYMYYWEVQGPGLPYCCQLTSCITSPEGLIMISVGTCIIYSTSLQSLYNRSPLEIHVF